MYPRLWMQRDGCTQTHIQLHRKAVDLRTMADTVLAVTGPLTIKQGKIVADKIVVK